MKENKEITKEYTKPVVCSRCGGADFRKRGTEQLSGGERQR